MAHGSGTPHDVECTLECVSGGSRDPDENVHEFERASRPWVYDSGVQALGIGEKISDGVNTGALALRIYVEQKRPLSQIENPAPKRIEGLTVEPVTTDVLEIGRIEREMFTGTSNPLMSGCGVGNVVDNNGGTLGAVVRRRSDGQLALLSNAHVLARDGLGNVGEAILQPAPIDGGHPDDDLVARLSDTVPFEFGDGGFPNLVDAAIADLDPTRASRSTIRLLGHAPTGITKNIRRGMHVHKVGRTSDLTYGVIQDVHFLLHFQLRKSPQRYARAGFGNQVMCTRFTERGDSGSLVLSSSGRAVGLHFAGSPSASIFNRIGNVLDALSVDLIMEDDR